MKKIIFPLVLVGTCIITFAQVGVGTNTPASTLDIKEKRTGAINDVAVVDGILAPRLTKAELVAKTAGIYGSNQNGIIVYVTDFMNIK